MKDKKKLNAPIYRLLKGPNKSALRVIWHHSKAQPHTPEGAIAHSLRRQRILDRICVLEEPKTTPIWKRNKYIAAAAIILIFFFVGYFFYNRSAPTIDNHNFTSSGSSRHIVLPDSTTITLAPYSTLSWRQVDGQFDRQVFLKGRATFAVTRKMHQSFTVKTKNMGVKVLGTVFTVEDSNTSRAQKVSVQEGKVAVHITTSNSKSYTLLPGQQLTNSDGNTQVISKLKTKSYRSDRQIKLASSTLGQFADQLSQAYAVEVYVTPSIRNSGALTAEFEAMDLEQVLKLISRTIEINYRIQSNKVYISQKK